MFNLAKTSQNKVNSIQSSVVELSGETMEIKRYSGSDIDELTGDPTDSTTRTYTSYIVPVTISDTEDYRSKIDAEYTNELVKNIRVIMSSQGRIYPLDTDVFVVSYGGTERSYRALSIKWIGNKIQLDLKEVDRK